MMGLFCWYLVALAKSGFVSALPPAFSYSPDGYSCFNSASTNCPGSACVFRLTKQTRHLHAGEGQTALHGMHVKSAVVGQSLQCCSAQQCYGAAGGSADCDALGALHCGSMA